MYTVSDLKNELTGVIHGTTLNQITGLNVLINRAARTLLSDFDPMETIRLVPLASPLYNQIYDYPIPVDAKGDRIIDIRPQVNRTPQDRFVQTYNEPFDAYKAVTFYQPEFTVQWNSAVKSIRILKNLIPTVLVNGANLIQDNGTWSVAGTATNLQQDNINFVYGTSSLEFDASAGADPSAASLENSTMTAVDLSEQANQGSLFCYVFLPSTDPVYSCTLRWGSSATDYWEKTVTVTQTNTAFQAGWNLLQFDWVTATSSGSPDSTSVTYVKFSINTDGSVAYAYRLNVITAALGSIYDIEYYSKYLFRDFTTGAFQETVTSDTNIINLDTDSYNVFFNLVALYCAQQIQGADSKFDTSFWQQAYDQAKTRYVAKIRSQVLKPTLAYYQMPKRRVTFIRWSSM